MKYMGSKSRIAKYIVPIIQNYIDENNKKFENTNYIEPFCGGCNVIDKIKNANKYAVDYNKFLIELLKYVKHNGEFPETITREEYSLVRDCYRNYEQQKGLYPDWYIGCVGFLASYNGRFFDGGYAQAGYEGKRYRDYYAESKRNLESQILDLEEITFACKDYRQLDFEKHKNNIIYCDPPYQGTKQYSNSKSFNHDEFWETMRKWSKNNIVLISEENAPEDFECIWSAEVSRSIKAQDKSVSVEKLFKYKYGLK